MRSPICRSWQGCSRFLRATDVALSLSGRGPRRGSAGRVRRRLGEPKRGQGSTFGGGQGRSFDLPELPRWHCARPPRAVPPAPLVTRVLRPGSFFRRNLAAPPGERKHLHEHQQRFILIINRHRSAIAATATPTAGTGSGHGAVGDARADGGHDAGQFGADDPADRQNPPPPQRRWRRNPAEWCEPVVRHHARRWTNGYRYAGLIRWADARPHRRAITSGARWGCPAGQGSVPVLRERPGRLSDRCT